MVVGSNPTRGTINLNKGDAMVSERKDQFKFRDHMVTIIGDDIVIGQKAPDFKVHTIDWGQISALRNTKNKVRIIAAVPSLDSTVCDRETRRFNVEAASLGEDISIITVSMDLPYSQKRWCGAAGVDQVMVVSDHLKGDFGKKYGVLLKEVGVFRRAVFVVDRKNIVIYAAYMPVNGDEPKYEEVIQAAKNALKD
jgi:thiol peroxidase